MFGLTFLRERTARLTSAQLIATVMTVMVALVVFGFGAIVYEQSRLGDIREQTRQMRMARQAMMEADSAVLNTLALPDRRHTDTMAYARALQKLEGHADSHFPASITRADREMPIGEVLSTLKTAWRTVMDQADGGNVDDAKASYQRLGIPVLMADLVATIFQTLNGLETDYATTQAQIDITMSVVLAMQIVAGLICVLAFTYAARHSSSEAKARALAVVEANAARDQVERLFAMTDMLQSANDQADANAVLRATATELLAGFHGALYVFNNSRDRLTLSTSWGLEGESAPPTTLAIDHCWALKRGKTHINQPSLRGLCCAHHTGGESALEIPMMARGEILGLLVISVDGPCAEMRLNSIASMCTALADATSLALANLALREKLRSQALRDPLTGLYNRRYLEDALSRLAMAAERDRREFAVIMIDLDHFKRLNDEHGHAKGDAVLRDSAAAIMGLLRDTDMACRYGGEELIVLLPDCGASAAAAKAEMIRGAIEALTEPNGAQVSASMGVAALPTHAATTKDLLARADAALYLAKQSGRNRVVVAPVPLAEVTALAIARA